MSRALLRALVLAACAGVAGCAGSTEAVAEDAPRASVPPRPAPDLASPERGGAASAGLPLGTVAGERVDARHLIDAWHELSPRDLWLVVDKLVATRLARAEAERIGVELSPEAVEAAFAHERDRLERSVAETAPGATVAEFVAGRLGVEPARYFRRLRASTIERMLTERAVRAWVLAQSSRSVRLLVVRADEVEQIQGLLAGGADLEELARTRSLDDTAESGGLVPYLVATEGSLLSEAAFEAEPDEVVGPLARDDLRLFLRVEAIRRPRPEAWAASGDAVEASLAQTPLSDSEYVPWKLAMERQWPVDLEALAELVGAAR